ncbi:MAG TPA: MBL fold metallo-hydrolase [Gemmatimonadaceae bacterium]|jgi:glyoxylase-like metal-dependent hydrolase (beta-lactamase superfamily II)|nr:MBL fold metallo-hydrolase [Gemmatimonadaceae bacterium]
MTATSPRIQTRTFGSLRVHAIEAGHLKLDGGAMFGIVPKTLWERRIPADDRNRILLTMRCLLVEHSSGLILIDTGLGNKENEKFHDIYGVENAGANGRTALEDGLAQLGVRPEDINILINTHLHFDHAGGNTYVDESGTIRLSFPKARYIAQRREFDDATHPNERTRATYLEGNVAPMQASGQLELIDGDREIVSGISVKVTPGHTPGHQSILIDSGGERAVYLGDLAPTRAHLPLPWVMGFDVEPLVTLETKRHLFKRVLEEDRTVIFDHDAEVAWGRVENDGKAYVLRSEQA